MSKCGLLGKTPEEAGIAGAGAKAWRERLSRVIESGETAVYSGEYPAAGGARFFESRFLPSGTVQGEVDQVTVVSRDIADQDLRATHEMFSALVHASPLPIVALAPGGEITVWNEAAEGTFGWKAEEVLGKSTPFIPEYKLEEHRAMRAHGLHGLGFTDLKIERRRQDGSLIDLSVSTAALRGAHGAGRA